MARSAPTGGGRTAAGTIAPPLRMATLVRAPIPHVTVEIRDVEHRQLVTVIEILSPTNKRGEGYDEYLGKRDRILRSTAHLMEIDLLRKGLRVPMQGTLPSTPYFIFLSRFDQRLLTDIWPIPLDQPLPEVPVPLLPGDADSTLDLQEALTNVYDDSGLKYMIDYCKSPEIPLSPGQEAWVDERLRAVGLRH